MAFWHRHSMTLSQRAENPWFSVAIESKRMNSYCDLASYVVLLYDYLLTIEKEIKFIWPTPWSRAKCLYITARYLALFDGAIVLYLNFAPPKVLPSTCTLLYILASGLMILGMMVSGLVLVFRTSALGQGKRFGVLLLLLFAVLSVPASLLEFLWGSVTRFGPSPNPQLISCWMSKGPSGPLFLDYISIIVFESVILALTIYKVVTSYGTEHHLPVAMRDRTTLVETLYFDGIIYYIYLLTISIINVIFLMKSVDSSSFFVLMQRDLHSIFTTRILLNLRDAAGRNSTISMPATDELAVEHEI